MLPYTFEEIKMQFESIRKWAGEITEGNRCAVVVGMTLKIKPKGFDVTFRGLVGAKPEVRNQPFLDKFFVKAEELASRISEQYGPPDITVAGNSALKEIKAQKGVVYLRNCWRTPIEKITFSAKKTGDHIDLWDGGGIATYPNGGTTLVQNAEAVLLWKCK